MAIFLVQTGSAARANTYLFSFTVQQVMNALQTSEGTSLFNESAYYAIFVQPDPAVISGYTYSLTGVPNYDSANPWESTTITDPSSPNLGYDPDFPCTSDCTWAQFSKGSSQTQVGVVSGANGGPGGSNIFLNASYSNLTSPPYGWGSTVATITEIMATGNSFYFRITTSQTLSGSYHLKGYASALESASPLSFSSVKETDAIPFDLTITAMGIPEPGTLGLTAIAAGLIAAYWARESRRRGGRYK